MAVLWRRGSGTVTEVRNDLDDELAYTTVLTILRTLEDKGFVTHVAEGKAHRYVPTVTHDVAGKSALARLLDKIFAGSSEVLLTNLSVSVISTAGSCAGCATCSTKFLRLALGIIVPNALHVVVIRLERA